MSINKKSISDLLRNPVGFRIRFLLLAGILLCFYSCASTAAVREGQLYVWLADNAKYILLPPENIKNSMDGYQLVSVSFDGRDYDISSWVKADETGIDMTLINELGTTMGELSYNGGAVSFSSSVFPKSIRGEYIVADFQLCFYDALALRHALEACGLSFTLSGSGHSSGDGSPRENAETGRRVFQGETLIIEIEKNRNVVRVINYLRGYSYTLEGNFQ